MIIRISPENIPDKIRSGNTIQKPLLYQFCTLFNDSEIKKLIHSKKQEMLSKKIQLDFEVSEMERTNSYIERGNYAQTSD